MHQHRRVEVIFLGAFRVCKPALEGVAGLGGGGLDGLLAAQDLLNVRSVAAVKGHGHRGAVGDGAAHRAVEGAAGDGAVAYDLAVCVKNAALDLARAVDRAAHRALAHVQVAVDLSVVLHDKRGLLVLLFISQAALYDAVVLHDKGQRIAVVRHQGDIACYLDIVLKGKGIFAAVY